MMYSNTLRAFSKSDLKFILFSALFVFCGLLQAQQVYLQLGSGYQRSGAEAFNNKFSFYVEPGLQISKRCRAIFHFSALKGQTYETFYSKMYVYQSSQFPYNPIDSHENVNRINANSLNTYQFKFQYQFLDGKNWFLYTRPGLGAVIHRARQEYDPAVFASSLSGKSYFTLSNDIGIAWKFGKQWQLHADVSYNHVFSKFRGEYEPDAGYNKNLLEDKDHYTCQLRIGLSYLLYSFKGF